MAAKTLTADERFAQQKAEIEAAGKQWCDAEYCDNPDCTKVHIHHLNCRCDDCFALDNED